MKSMVVYKTTNNIDGKVYIGKTIGKGPSYLGSGVYLNRAIKKYGRDNFEKEIMGWCDTKNKLDFLEKFYIEFFESKTPNGYNLTDGGDGFNGKHTDETKKKMSVTRLGRSCPWLIGNILRRGKKSPSTLGDFNPSKRPEVREKIRQKMIGRKVTWNDNISKAFKGRKAWNKGLKLPSHTVTKETRDKISQTLMGHIVTQTTKDKISKTLRQ